MLEKTEIDGVDNCGIHFVKIPMSEIVRLYPQLASFLSGAHHGMRDTLNQSDNGQDAIRDSLGPTSAVCEGVWEADTALFTSGWSSSFAHGADTLLPVGTMLERLLPSDEKVATIDALRWQKIIRQNMRLTARMDPFAKKELASSLMTVSLTTNKGRSIHMRGEGNGQEINGKAPRNPVAEQLFTRGPMEAKVNTKGWHEYPLGNCDHSSNEEITRPGMTMCTAIDLINYGVLYSKELKQYDATGTRLFLGVKDFTVPDTSKISRVRIRMQHEKVKLSEKGFHVVPVQVEYIDNTRELIGGGLSYFAFPQDEKAVKEFERDS